MLKIGIIGAGTVGSALAVRLAESGLFYSGCFRRYFSILLKNCLGQSKIAGLVPATSK